MIFRVDTAQKIIEVEDNWNLGDLIKELASMFPDGEWKNYQIMGTRAQMYHMPVTDTKTNWGRTGNNPWGGFLPVTTSP